MSELEELQKRLDSAEYIIAFILQEVGPVEVKKEYMQRGFPEGTQIKIVEDIKRDVFVISLEDDNV